jgi:hypothetical protein
MGDGRKRLVDTFLRFETEKRAKSAVGIEAMSSLVE